MKLALLRNSLLLLATIGTPASLSLVYYYLVAARGGELKMNSALLSQQRDPNGRVSLSRNVLHDGVDSQPNATSNSANNGDDFKLSKALLNDGSSVELPLVLGWTKFFHPYYTGFIKHLRDKGREKVECSRPCEYSDDRSKYHPNRPTVFLYHSVDIDSADLPQPPPVGYHLNVFFAVESPLNTIGDYRLLPANFFNLTMSYRLDSDLWWPYNSLQLMDAKEKESESGTHWAWSEVEERVMRKNKLILFVASNCGTPSRREHYLHALKAHININTYGRCFYRACEGNCLEEEIDSHLFYLAFENSVCRDYITEKFWHMKRLIVPMVLSRLALANYPAEILPPNAYIAADDFDSPQELAEHLLYLEQNRTAYLQLFEWTRHYRRTDRTPPIFSTMGNSYNLCQLCKIAHDRRKAQVDDIVDFWERQSECKPEFATRQLLRKQ